MHTLHSKKTRAKHGKANKVMKLSQIFNDRHIFIVNEIEHTVETNLIYH